VSGRKFRLGLAAALCLTGTWSIAAVPGPANPPDAKQDGDSEKGEHGKFEPFKAESVSSSGTVTVGGQAVSYQAIAGTLVVHPKDWDDVPRDPKADKGTAPPGDEGADAKNPTAEASMLYAKDTSLKLLHDNVAGFIRRTAAPGN
jgi:hypothetical protein